MGGGAEIWYRLIHQSLQISQCYRRPPNFSSCSSTFAMLFYNRWKSSHQKKTSSTLFSVLFYASVIIGTLFIAGLMAPKTSPFPLPGLFLSIFAGIVLLSVFFVGIREVYLQHKEDRAKGISLGWRSIVFWFIVAYFAFFIIGIPLVVLLEKSLPSKILEAVIIALGTVVVLWVFGAGLRYVYLKFRVAHETGYGRGKATFFWWIVLTSLMATVLSNPSRTSKNNKQIAKSSIPSLERIQGESDSSFAIRLVPIGLRNQVEATIAKDKEVLKVYDWQAEPVTSEVFVVSKACLSKSERTGWYFEVNTKNKTFKVINGDSVLEKKYGFR